MKKSLVKIFVGALLVLGLELAYVLNHKDSIILYIFAVSWGVYTLSFILALFIIKK